MWDQIDILTIMEFFFSSPDMSLASGLVEHEGELTEEQVIL